MSLHLGQSFNRNYNIRFSLLGGFYNIGIFYNTKSPFLLFNIDSDFSQVVGSKCLSSKVNMFKNIESSIFCETFLDLHNYTSNSLDIINQFKEIKGEYNNDILLIMNENIVLNKIYSGDSTYFDQLIIYGFTLSSYQDDFIFILTERQNIITKIKRKIVRSSAIQIASSKSLEIINDYNKEQKNSKIFFNSNLSKSDETIKLE